MYPAYIQRLSYFLLLRTVLLLSTIPKIRYINIPIDACSPGAIITVYEQVLFGVQSFWRTCAR